MHTTGAHTAPVQAICPGFTSHGNKRAKTAVVLMHAGSRRNMGRDVARGHSQTWESRSTPRFPYTVRALLSEGQKLSHWQQEASRQEVWRQAERGVWVQTVPCPSCSFPAAMKGSRRTMSTLPHFKKLTRNNYSVSLSSLYSIRIQRKMSGLIKEVEQLSHKGWIDKEFAT